MAKTTPSVSTAALKQPKTRRSYASPDLGLPFTDTYTQAVNDRRAYIAGGGALPMTCITIGQQQLAGVSASRCGNESSGAMQTDLQHSQYTPGSVKCSLLSFTALTLMQTHLHLRNPGLSSHFTPVFCPFKRAYAAFCTVCSLSLIHLQPFTAIYARWPTATHALTPLLKGVSARGEKSCRGRSTFASGRALSGKV